MIMTIRRVLIPLLLLPLVACGDDKGTGPDKNEVASVTVTPPSSTIEVGEAVQLSAEVKNAEGTVLSATVEWTSGTPTVASVSGSGMVTGLADGTATITASAGGQSGSATVVVEDLDPPAAPSDVSATPVSNTEVEVTWTDNSDNEETFRIDREMIVSGTAGADGQTALVAEEVGSVGPGVTSFRDTGLSSSSSYRYGVRACNKNGCTEHTGEAAAVTTNPELVLLTASLPGGMVGEAYEQTLEATGGAGSISWSVSGGALPSGLTLSGAGVLSGTPTAAGTSDFTIQAQSGDGQTASADFSVKILGVLAVTTTSLPNGIEGTAYSEALAATGGEGTYTWSLLDGSLPSGLSLSEGGTISGTPTAGGTSEFTVQVQSEDGQTASAALSLTINGILEVTTTSLPSGIVGAAYSGALAAAGGDGSYDWTVTGGALPDGLSMAASGAISGTPTTAGTSDFTVQVLSGDGQTAGAELSISVYPVLGVTTTSLPHGAVGAAYSVSLAANGGGGGHTWSLLEGTLPAGISLAEDGTISGTPTEDGTFNLTVQVQSRDGQTASAPFSIIIYPALEITTESLPDGVVGITYSQVVGVTGGDGSYNWSLSAGTVPDGLSFADGTISGTATSVGTSNFSVHVESGDGQTVDADLSISINAVLAVTTAVLPDGATGFAYSEVLAASGGDGSYSWSLSAGTLPDGLSLATDGTISGTPTTEGTSDFSVEVESGDGQTADADLSIIVVAGGYNCTDQSEIPVAECQALVSLYNATDGESWTSATEWVTTDTPCSWYGITCSGGSVTGVSLGSNGLSGSIPDLSALTNLEQLRLYANQLTGGIPSSLGSLPSLDRLDLYNNELTGSIPSALGDLTSLRYLSLRQNQLTGSIPASLGNLSSLLSLHLYENELSGSIPAALGGLSNLQQLDIGGNSLDGSIPSELGNLTNLQALGLYRNDLTGSIPSSLGNLTSLWGLSLHENELTGSIPSQLGALSGLQVFRLFGNQLTGVVPLSVAQLGGQIQATYGNSGCTIGNTGNPDLSLTNNQDYRDADQDNDGAICYVGGLTLDLEVTTASLADGIVGTGYNASLSATGGDQPYTWTVSVGDLPDGLTLAADGTISGTPTTEETATFTVQVASNTDGQTATAELSITIYSVLEVTTGSLPGGITGTAYSESLAATGGDGSYTWTLASAAETFPTGLSLGTDGTITGTPTVADTFNFTVQVDSGDGQTATAALSIEVTVPPPTSNPD
jgi:Leucine-rich repeat (LRR) protein